jgi:hypothetical protein
MIGMRLKSEIAQQTLSDRNASYAACLVCGMLRMRHASHAWRRRWVPYPQNVYKTKPVNQKFSCWI